MIADISSAESNDDDVGAVDNETGAVGSAALKTGPG